MKTNKLMAIALCAVACTFATTFAEDDSGLESATPAAPVITDPVNPQPGMIFSAYGGYDWMYPMKHGSVKKAIENFIINLKESVDKLPALPAVKTGVDKSDKFSIACASGVATAAIRWEGFLKCKVARTYTFLIQKECPTINRDTFNWCAGYAIRINGKNGGASYGQTSFDANLKVGFNKVEIVTLLPGRDEGYGQGRMDPLNIAVKPKGSVIEPVKLSPNKLFFDARPELTETGLDL